MNEKRVLLPVLAAVLVVAGAASALGAVPLRQAFPKTLPSAHRVTRAIDPALTKRFRTETWRWQTLIGLRRTQSWAPLNTRVALRFWRRHARYSRRLALHPPHGRGWLCIHRYEGSWTDSGDPYWGGLQMDRGFMRTYAPRTLLRRGWANRWTPLEQIWVAERAHRSGRGYWPWPNTARYCGLL